MYGDGKETKNSPNTIRLPPGKITLHVAKDSHGCEFKESHDEAKDKRVFKSNIYEVHVYGATSVLLLHLKETHHR